MEGDSDANNEHEEFPKTHGGEHVPDDVEPEHPLPMLGVLKVPAHAGLVDPPGRVPAEGKRDTHKETRY